MAIIGLRDTTGFTTTGERPQNWRETLLVLYPIVRKHPRRHLPL